MEQGVVYGLYTGFRKRRGLDEALGNTAHELRKIAESLPEGNTKDTCLSLFDAYVELGWWDDKQIQVAGKLLGRT